MPVNAADPLGLDNEDIVVIGRRMHPIEPTPDPMGQIAIDNFMSSKGESGGDQDRNNQQNCTANPLSYADAARDVGEVVSDIGAAAEVGGLVAAAAFPPVGGAVAFVGAVTTGVGTGIVFVANVSQGRWGAAIGNVAAFGAGMAAGRTVASLGRGAWRDAATGRFVRNPFGGDLRKAKKAIATFTASKAVDKAADAVRCSR